MGKIIDAEFGGRNAGDRYCASCHERFPRRAALCPRCGGALTLWATHSAAKKRSGEGSLGRSALAFVVLVLLLLAALIVALR